MPEIKEALKNPKQAIEQLKLVTEKDFEQMSESQKRHHILQVCSLQMRNVFQSMMQLNDIAEMEIKSLKAKINGK